MRLTFIILLLNISINLFPVNISFAPLPNQQKLSSSSVISSKEDNDKYLWFATNDGLYRYDGYNVLPFKMNTQQNNPMRSNEITFLGGELDGKFWFGTTAGTYFIDKKNNYRITAPPFDNNTESATRYIYILSDKTILIATDHDMIVRYSAQGELIGSFNVNHSIDINCIIEDRKGNIFIAFWGRNISMFDKNSGEFTPLRKSSAINQCTTILQDPDYDYLWINSWGNGIVRFDPYAANVKDMFIIQNETVQNDGVLHDTHDIHNMVIDNHTGYIWTIGWKNAINIYERNPDGSLSRKDYIDNYAPGLNNIILNDITALSSGNLLISSYDNQILEIDLKEKQYEYSSIDELKEITNANVSVLSGEMINDSILIFVQERIGLHGYDIKNKQLIYGHNFCCDKVDKNFDNTVIKKDLSVDNKAWISFSKKGKIVGIVFDGKDLIVDKFIYLEKPLRTSDNSFIETNFIIESDKSGNLYIADGKDLYYLNTETFEKTPVIENIKNIISLETDPNGIIYVCTKDNGVYFINKLKPEHYPFDETISAFTKGHDKDFYITTTSGKIFKFNTINNKYIETEILKELISDKICDMHIDYMNHLWFVTYGNVIEYSLNTGCYNIYRTTDINNPISSYLQSSLTEMNNGEIITGGINGFAKFSSDRQLDEKSYEYKTSISDFRINDKSLITDYNNEHRSFFNDTYAELDADQKNAEIYFSTPGRKDISRICFAYRLNSKEEWTHLPAGDNKLVLSLKSSGLYKLEVICMDENGRWSSQIKEFRIYRKPPYYLSGIAIIIYSLLAIILLITGVSLYLKYLRKEDEIELRESIANVKMNYFTNISHDLLTPLTIISCATEEINNTDKDKEINIGLIKSNINRLKHMLQQVLDLKKIEKGIIDLSLSYGDILSFTRGVCESFGPLIKKHEIDFCFEAATDELSGYFDMDKIDKILFNLISNAIKYTPAGRKVWVNLNTETYEGINYAIIKVGDKGIGIAKDKIEHIFTEFQNVKKSVAVDSNGLGLSISKKLIEFHKGVLTVESTEGIGSVFTIKFPIDIRSYQKEEDKDESPLSESDSFDISEKPRLLVVDDDTDLRDLIKRLFSDDYNVFAVSDGIEALEVIESQNINIVISDVKMPRMDGLELCRKIKQNVNTSHISVILLTAKIQTSDRIQCYEAGADAYIAKPFEMKVLEARLENLLKRKKALEIGFAQNTELNVAELEVNPVDEKFLNKVIGLITDNLSDSDYDINRLASDVNMSRSTLSRKMKAVTGQTVIDFIHNIKMKKACLMLKETNENITEVAACLGYDDSRYFSSSFKNTFGITPRDFRKNNGVTIQN